MPSISLARQPPHPHRYQQTHHRHTRSRPPTFGETVQHPRARASHHQCRQHLALQRNGPFSLPVAHHRAEMAVFAQPAVETRRRARPTACRQQHERHSRQSRQKDADNTQDQRQPTRQPHKRPPQRQVRIAAGLSAMPYPRHPPAASPAAKTAIIHSALPITATSPARFGMIVSFSKENATYS